MKIVLLNDDFPPNSCGGAGIVVYNLARELQKTNHEVFIITATRIKSEERESDLGCLKIFKIYSCYHERWRSWKGLINPQTITKVEKIIKKINPDIVHAHNIHYHLSYRSLKIAKKYSKAVFLTAHDVMSINYGKLMPRNGKDVYKITFWQKLKSAKKRFNPFRDVFIKKYLKCVDKIFAVSDSLKELLILNGINNVETIYNGIDVDQYKENLSEIDKFKIKHGLQNKKVLFFGARPSIEKGVFKILETIALLKDVDKNIVLLFAGIDRTNKFVEKEIDSLKINDNIISLGWLDEEELKLAIFSSDIVVSPSLCFETFNLVNLEAMACKKPVISSFFGGPKEVVLDNQTGYLINPNNIVAIKDRTWELLQNPIKMRQFGEAGYEQAKEKFSLKKKVEETLKWYEKYV